MTGLRLRSSMLLFLALTACEAQQPVAKPAEEPVEAEASAACEARRFEGSKFTICSVDTNKEDVQLRWKGADGRPMGSFGRLEQELGPDILRVRFAMNAGMFDQDQAPIGLYVENGERMKRLNRKDGPGNFHLSPNGVFAVDGEGEMSIVSSEVFGVQIGDPLWATQSGPMLVIEGELHPRFEADGQSRFVRNGVGVRDPHHAFFVISEDAVSFGRLARLFRDELDCANALYFDGSVSSLWHPASRRRDSYSQLGPMVVVLRKPAAQAPGPTKDRTAKADRPR